MKSPIGWVHTTFDKHVDCLTGFAFKSSEYSNDDKDLRLLRGDNIEPGNLRWRDAKYWRDNAAENLDKYRLNEGDFVIALDRTWISSGLKVAEVTKADLPCLLVQRVARVRAKPTLEQSLLRQYFSGHRFEQYVKSVQTATAVPHISPNDIKEFPVSLPPLPEQKKIAQILSTWDKAITTTEQLLANSQQQKKALMQQLLTGKKRFPGFNDRWKKLTLSQFLIPTSYPIDKPNFAYKAVGIRSHGKGTFQRLVKDPDTVAMDTLYSLKPNEFIVNITFAWEGAVAIVQEMDDGCLVSHRFPTFKICEEKILVNFMRQLIITPSFFHLLKLISPGGAGRNRVLDKKELLDVELNVPSIEEQKLIANILRSADQLIERIETQLTLLKQEKKALMQQLLTGKRRVKLTEQHL